MRSPATIRPTPPLRCGTRPDFATGIDHGVKGLRIGVVRHFWEKDQPVHAELPPALEAAISLFRDLGATVEDVTLRPLQILLRRQDRRRRERAVLAASARADRQARCLRAGLQGAQPRRLPVHGRGLRAREPRAPRYPGGDAAALPPVRSVPDGQRLGRAAARPARSALVLEAAESRPSPFNCTGGPALAVLCGFTNDGLPLSLQIAGRPFDDAQRAAGWPCL